MFHGREIYEQAAALVARTNPVTIVEAVLLGAIATAAGGFLCFALAHMAPMAA